MDQTSGNTGERDHFIPARKIDVLNAVIADGGLGSEPERDQFRQLCKLLGAIYPFNISNSSSGCATTTSTSAPTPTAMSGSTAPPSNAPTGI